MKLNLIFSTNTEGYIGQDGKILYKFSDDLKHFKAITTTKKSAIVMGANTFAEFTSPLPDRKNVILIDPNRELSDHIVNGIYRGADIITSLSELSTYSEYEIFIIGGAVLINYVLENHHKDVANIFLTKVNDSTVGDTQINIKKLRGVLTELLKVTKDTNELWDDNSDRYIKVDFIHYARQ